MSFQAEVEAPSRCAVVYLSGLRGGVGKSAITAALGIDVREATLRKMTENRAKSAPSEGAAKMPPSAPRAVKENKQSNGVLRSENEDV